MPVAVVVYQVVGSEALQELLQLAQLLQMAIQAAGLVVHLVMVSRQSISMRYHNAFQCHVELLALQGAHVW